VPDHFERRRGRHPACAALTAWLAIVDFGAVKPGDVVLIEGTGGVALFALKFSRRPGRGLRSSRAAMRRSREPKRFGADYRRELQKRTGMGKSHSRGHGKGVDLVVELGGAATLAQALILLNSVVALRRSDC